MNIVNKIVLHWEVQDPIYSYQGYMEFTPEEFRSTAPEEILAKQTEQYNEWYAKIKTLEEEQ